MPGSWSGDQARIAETDEYAALHRHNENAAAGDPVVKAWLDGYAAAIEDLERLLPGRVAAVMADLKGDLTELKKAGQRRSMRQKLKAG